MNQAENNTRYDVQAVRRFANDMFQASGLDASKAAAVADILIEADLLGHSTHGLALAPWYLEAAASGVMALAGEPEIISDRGACITWNGRRLPGAWLAAKAMDLAIERAATYGTVTLVIADCGHVGALAAYMERATERGYMAMMASSTPSAAGVAPFGGTRAAFTPNPLAAGIPTDADPMLLDISASITTINRARQLARQGEVFPGAWALDKNGEVSADPQVLVSQGGTLLPVGGLDHGHKGYSLALLVEMLTQGLAGFGRADGPTGISVSLFIQVLDPSAFGGGAAFKRQSTHLGDICRSNPPRAGVEAVRVPGDRAMASKRDALARGLGLSASIVEGLQPWVQRYGLQFPSPASSRP